MVVIGGMLSSCDDSTTAGANDSIQATSSDRAAERSLIRRTVRRAKREGTDGNATKTCAYLTPEGRQRAIQAYSQRYGKPLASCAQMVRFARKKEASYLSDARHATIRRVTVQGAAAAVSFEGPKVGGYGGIVRVKLRKIGARWQVDDTDFVPYGTGE